MLRQVCMLDPTILERRGGEAGQKGAGCRSEDPQKAVECGTHSSWGHWARDTELL